jgi:hypothetical protein
LIITSVNHHRRSGKPPSRNALLIVRSHTNRLFVRSPPLDK